MPFEKKISTKNSTGKCHFTSLTFPGMRGKQLAEATRMTEQGTLSIRVTSRWGTAQEWRVVFKDCYVVQLWLVCNKYQTFLKTCWGKNEFSEYAFSSFSSCWMLSDVQGTPPSVLYSIFIGVQNSLFTIPNGICIERFLLSLFTGFVSFCFVLVQKHEFVFQPTPS